MTRLTCAEDCKYLPKSKKKKKKKERKEITAKHNEQITFLGTKKRFKCMQLTRELVVGADNKMP